jgi:hypothetical protein
MIDVLMEMSTMLKVLLVRAVAEIYFKLLVAIENNIFQFCTRSCMRNNMH